METKSKHDDGFRAPETVAEMERENPTTPAPVRFHEWHSSPVAWCARFASEPDKAFGALRGLLESPATDLVRCAGEIGALLETVATTLRYHIRGDSRFIAFGPIVIPTIPRGLDALRAIQENASELVTGQTPRSVLDDSSALARLLDELERVAGFRGSAILERASNRTSSASEVSGFRIGFTFHARALASMPNGTTLPPALLTPALVGREVSGDDARTIQSDAGMCESGTIEFLQRFDIDHETEGGSYECDSCGHERDDDDEGGEVSWIGDFTLTQDMVDALESQSYADAFRDHFGSEDGTDEWSGLLENATDAEIRERCAPDAENGIKYDSSVWEFSPDFEAIDELENLEWSEQARALPLVATIASEHASAGVLPPIPGLLVLKSAPYERSAEPRRADFHWSPDAGTLTHNIGGALRLRIDARNGGVRLLHMIDGAERGAPLTQAGSEHVLDAPAYEGGERAARLLAIVKGSAGI